MKRICLTILTCLTVFSLSMAQENNKFDKNKLEFGGVFGLSFGKSRGSSSTSFQISPQVGYRFNNLFSAGLGVGYIYRDWDDYTENYAGLNLYARLRPIKYIMLLAEPHLYRSWGSHYKSRFVPSLLLGGGVTMPVGFNGGISFTLSYDVIQNDYSPFRRGIMYSIGYVFGF